MEKLYNLSIRKKFAVVIVPLVVTIVFFDFFHIRHDYLDYKDSARLNKAINVSYQVTHLLHELQLERSFSVGRVLNDSDAFVTELHLQRKHTDSVLHRYHDELEDIKFAEIFELHQDNLDEFQLFEDQLLQLRELIDEKSLSSRSIIEYYSDINQAGLRLINSLINEARDKVATQQVHAIIYFLEAKEYASIERALGTQIFSSQEEDPNINAEFAGLLASQNAYMDAFTKISNEESVAFYHEIMQGNEVEEVARLRELLYEGKGFSIEPDYWHEIISNKIDALKRVEEYMLEEMHNYTENLAANSWGQFWTFLMIDMLIAALSFFLMGFIVTKLIKDVAILELFTKKVAKGDLSHKVKIETKDEIGHYAATFNLMVNEINKSQQELKKAKNYAEYLYENIYKQSQVVFENVEQGIFLLDKDFKISNLYSKAVERIFDNETIANENFCNFMRPRIIQRDYEALEMFMKHLFNIDLDEEVVNQLNPIEQVKIFISTNGVVITKHLRVSFTRIERANEIQTILVTISDETESVLLQQHMEESEAKKKKETEYMLNIFKVDPSILREFLQSTKEAVKSISTKYETSAKSDLSDLLKYTFQEVHNMKGNAMSIGVEIMTEKLNDIEESITKLREKNVSADKFLALLYELEEIDGMTSDMFKMLDKVGEVYKNFHSKKPAETTAKLEELLKNGLKNLSEESGKALELKFLNENSNVLPEEYLSPVKDIAIQMMRNSISHGIETPEVRKSKGKSSKGQITFSIDEAANSTLQFSYKDDGKGLDMEHIKQKALSLNILSPEDAETIQDHHLVDLLFENGFSTTDKADNFSGRGQGLSLVKTIIEDLDGEYTLRFEKDKYFEITFNLPLMADRKIKKVA